MLLHVLDPGCGWQLRSRWQFRWPVCVLSGFISQQLLFSHQVSSVCCRVQLHRQDALLVNLSEQCLSWEGLSSGWLGDWVLALT